MRPPESDQSQAEMGRISATHRLCNSAREPMIPVILSTFFCNPQPDSIASEPAATQAVQHPALRRQIARRRRALCRSARARHQEFFHFLNVIEKQVPVGKTIQRRRRRLRRPQAAGWLERHPRWTLHFTPTSTPWLSAVEGFFATSQSAGSTAASFAPSPPASRDQPLPRRAQSAIEGLHLDLRSRQNHRRSQARAPSVKLDP